MIQILINDLKRVREEINKFNDDLPEELGKEITEEIKKNTPVDSGKLKDSIKSEVTESKIEWYSEEEYAPYVELGHLDRGGSFVKGSKMFEKGAKTIDKKVKKKTKKLEKNIDNIIGG